MEAVVAQHRTSGHGHETWKEEEKEIRRKGKIQVWKLEEEEAVWQFKLGGSEKIGVVEAQRTGEDQWNIMKQVMLEESVHVCSRKKSLKPTDKDTWWWSEEVQTAARKKKEAIKHMKEDGSMEASHEYKNSKYEVKQMVGCHCKHKEY